MKNYQKLIAAAVAMIGLLIGPEGLGLTDDATTARILEFLTMGVGLAAVWFFPNKPADDGATLNSPPIVGIAAVLLAVLTLGGCVSTLGINNDRLNTANKQLADKVLFVESMAEFATRLVQTRTISALQGRQVGGILQKSLNTLNETQAAISRSGDPSQAQSTLDAVDQSLAIVLDLLTTIAGPATASFLTQWEGQHA